MPKTGVEQVQHRVLHAADVHINSRPRSVPGWLRSHPIMFRLAPAELAVVARISEAEVIPAASRPLRHGVGLAPGAAGQFDPFFGPRQRRLAGGGGFEIAQGRRLQGQRRFRQGVVVKLSVGRRLPHYRKRLPPITLPAEKPIAQFVIDRLAAITVFLQPSNNLLFGIGRL